MNNAPLDRPGAVRAGEELDPESLGRYLRAHVSGADGELSIEQFPSGYSNLTYALTAGRCRLVLRRPPFGTTPKSGHDMGREFRVLSALAAHFPYCPRVLAFCDDPAIMGCPFYVMERVEGVIVRREYPPALAGDPALVRAQHSALVDTLVRLHAVDYAAAGLDDLGRPAGYVARQVSGWTRRYAAAHTPGAPDCSAATRWLEQNMPAQETRASLIHNDYKLDNVVWDASAPHILIGVLDWEMTTLGDPLMDLGCMLGYWVERDDPAYLQVARMMPTHVDGAMTRDELVARYRQASGVEIADLRFYHAFGLFRLAVILQQIYYRYHHGQTRDPRFAALPEQVAALARAATAVTAQGVP